MTNYLTKGANVALKECGSSVKDVFIGLGWNIKDSSNFDVDSSAFMLSKENKVCNDKSFIFYNQISDEFSCVNLDMQPANGEDSRGFFIRLAMMPKNVVKIVFSITIDQAKERKQHLGMVEGIYIRVLEDHPLGEELVHYNLDDINCEAALMIGELYRYNNEWKFRAVGQGYNGGLDILASSFGVRVDIASEELAGEAVGLKHKRRTSAQILTENALYLRKGLDQLLPQIQLAVEKQLNESNTRMILDKILMDVFGYKMEEIKTEQKIQGRKADYVLSIDDTDAVVIEVKKAGMPLRDQQVFQATSYGAYSGIRWAILTNLVAWQVYRITTQDRVEADLVFSVDFTSGLEMQDAERLVLISRYGMGRRGLLEKFWNEVTALRRESLISAILSEDVISKIRLVIKRDTGCSFTNEQIQQALDEILHAK